MFPCLNFVVYILLYTIRLVDVYISLFDQTPQGKRVITFL